MEKIRINTTSKDVEIFQLNIKIQQLSYEGLGALETLRTENSKLEKRVLTLIEKVRGLNADVKDLTKQSLNSHVVECQN